MSYEEQDTCIQIFDKFLGHALVETPSALVSSKFLTFAAAIAVILSAKLYSANPRITMVRFSDY